VTPFQRLVAVAALAGTLAGLLATAVHHTTTVPLILRAEVLEEAATPADQGDTHH
jgi:predicted cobalt transporter CbtA